MSSESGYKLGQTNVIDLWPVKFYQRSLSAIKEPNRALLKIIQDLDKSNCNVTTEYRDHNILNIDTLGTNWLRSEVNNSVIDYPVNWQIHAWSNINKKGDYHDTHNHPHSYMSGTYYLKVPDLTKKLPNRSDARPNHITFYDPRSGINMNSINKDPYINPEYTMTELGKQLKMAKATCIIGKNNNMEIVKAAIAELDGRFISDKCASSN